MRGFRPSELAHTYSIVARDAQTGQLGVAVQSHWFGVGRLVTWAEAGVGAVATQAMVQVRYGPLGLERMRQGLSAQEALAELLAADDGRELRQVAMVDAGGDVAAHTGSQCIAEAGQETGAGFSAQANMMATQQVWPAMARAYREACGDLAERLLSALDAAQAAGGDLRGKQSAAMLIVGAERGPEPWAGVLLELRVEDHPEPLAELRRLVTLQRAYEHMNQGDTLLGSARTRYKKRSWSTALPRRWRRTSRNCLSGKQ
jgi:uncharacterized Ntn-hydrolase superfamily protein